MARNKYKVWTRHKQGFANSNSVMKARFIWLLEELCQRNGVDIQLIDPSLTYSENKHNIESKTGIKLRFSPLFTEISDEEYAKWKAMEEWFNDLVGIKKGIKKDKKVPVDIGNIIRVARGED